MDISKPNSNEPTAQEPILVETNHQKSNMEISEADIEPSDPLLVEKLSIRLTDQLIRFHGCYRDCHDQSKRDHVDEHEIHYSLQTYLNEAANDALSSCLDVLSYRTIARHEDNIASAMIAAQKQQVYSRLDVDGPIETPKHIYLQEGNAPNRTAKVTFDIDSITRFPSSLGIAKGSIRQNAMQMLVSNL